MDPDRDPLAAALAAGLTRRRLARLAAAAGVATLLPAPLRALAAPATETYDDGDGEVPGGVRGDPERVIVVGAGWAGLTAANALRNAGVEAVVLEGRERLGGRARTKDVGGVPIDLGCSWIHQPIGNPMSEFANQAGVARTDANLYTDLPTLRFYDGVSGGEVLQPQVAATFAEALHFFDAAPDLDRRLGPGASVRDGARLYLKEQGLKGDARRRTAFAIRLLSEQPDNVFWHHLSLHYYATFSEPYDGVGEGVFPVGGYRRLVRAMASGTDVRFGHAVRRIERHRHGVVVHARVFDARGRARKVSFRGSHVIVTVPLGVLKAGTIGFPGGLPRRKRKAIGRIGFGRFEKVAMVFDEPFWEDGGKTHIVHVNRERDVGIRYPIVLDLQKISGQPALASLVAGRAVHLMHRLDKRERLAVAREQITTALGRRSIPDPVATAVTNWHGHPFSRGAYSTVLVGGDYPDFDALAEPVDGRLLFAGEATNRHRFGYADGAMSSGIREAKRLLRRPSVELSAG